MEKKKIVAATGCPTGIAHTFMAQEALELAAERLGVDIKVETHGQVGLENELSAEEIRDADGVIVASDKDVHAERFAGKPLVEVGVKRGINETRGPDPPDPRPEGTDRSECPNVRRVPADRPPHRRHLGRPSGQCTA
jgi:fructose-specific phosphotransferase system IIB component